MIPTNKFFFSLITSNLNLNHLFEKNFLTKLMLLLSLIKRLTLK